MISVPGKIIQDDKKLEVFLMTRILIILLSCLFLIPLPARADEPLHAILQGISKHYGNLPGLEIPYERGIISKTMQMMGDQQKSDFATGKLYFKSPNSLRIEQETPS